MSSVETERLRLDRATQLEALSFMLARDLSHIPSDWNRSQSLRQTLCPDRFARHFL